ncbi:uncharacterized protein LOC144665509 isoform X1 [Oculina patagonica]
MAAGGDEDVAYSSFTDSLSSNSSSFSSLSVSESTSTELTSSSEGDIQAFVDEGIYGWIYSLIEEEKVARFVNRYDGIYELDWQDVVCKYWFEWRAARRDPKSSKSTKFNQRTASNNLRAALLNSYKDKGAQEYPERKVMDKRNKTVKRCFRMPSTIIEKVSKKTGSTAVAPKTPKSLSDEHVKDQRNEGTVCPSTLPPLAMDFSSLNVDMEESDSLVYTVLNEEHHLDDVTLSSDDDVMPSSSDWTTSRYDAGSSGYESAEENLVKEMDPCEGPYQGGNMSFIFLEQSLNIRFPGAGNRCKVVFSSPKHSLTPREVTATVKNCLTIKVRIPHCPRLSGKQLACGKLTVQVLVKTLEGCYIGETRYTYSANLMAQFEQCVKALDDEEMELDFTAGSADQQHVMLNYKNANVAGSHLFNFASLRVLSFVAVKEKAYNFLLAFLKSSVVLAAFQHSRQKLMPLLEYVIRNSVRQTDSHPSVLGLCKKLLLESVANDEAVEHCKSSLASLHVQGTAANAITGEVMGISEQGYDGGSELETTQDQKVSLTDSDELKDKEAKIESAVSVRRCEEDENKLDVDHRNETEDKATLAQFTCSFTPEDKMAKQDKEERSQVKDELCKPKIVVLRKPCSPVPISRSRSSFPDPRTDVFVELQVRNNQRPSGDTHCQDEAIEHVTFSKQHETEHVPIGKQVTVEHVPVAKHQVTVDVRHSGTEQTARDWESKYVKRVSGKLGYWFRFYEPNCELSLMFTLYDKPHAAKSETKLKVPVLDHVTVVVETINWKGPFSKEAKTDKEPDKVELALTRRVPLVSLSRSQTKLCVIMNGLHKLCDNGEWAEFEEACKKLRQRCGDDHDVQVAILLEKAIAFLYQHDLEKAELTALEALDIVSKADNHQLLAGRAYYYLAHVYRREKKLGEAVRCIDLSKQNLHLMDVCLDQSFMAYEEGNVMKEFISSGAVIRKKLLLRAKQCFEQCLDLCRRLDDSHSQVIPHTHSFALIKIAMLLLDCGSTLGRERCVSGTHVAEAKRFLDLLQKHGLNEITQRRKLQFLLACSDLQYRLSNYKAAVHDAHQALDKAKELGFLLEVMPTSDRINHIRQLLASGGMDAYPDPI